MSDDNKKLNALQEMIKEQKKRKISSARRYMQKASFAKLSGTVIGGIITIISGINPNSIFGIKPNFYNLVLGVLIGVISTWTSFFTHTELWLVNVESINALDSLSEKIRYESSSDELSTEKLDAFFREYTTIVNSVNKKWLESRYQNTANQSQ
jgi:hypothetical protein